MNRRKPGLVGGPEAGFGFAVRDKAPTYSTGTRLAGSRADILADSRADLRADSRADILADSLTQPTRRCAVFTGGDSCCFRCGCSASAPACGSSGCRARPCVFRGVREVAATMGGHCKCPHCVGLFNSAEVGRVGRPGARAGQDGSGAGGGRHPRLIEDLKAFLDEREQPGIRQVILELGHAPTHQERPHPPQWPYADVGHAMISEDDRDDDGAGPGLHGDAYGAATSLLLEAAVHDSATSAAPATSQTSLTPRKADPGPSSNDGQARKGSCSDSNGSKCSVHCTSQPRSMEDKCLECCIYTGVQCCRCTIM